MGRIGALDQKVDRVREELSTQISALDQKLSKQFHVLAGMMTALFVAVVGAVAGGFFALR